MRSPPRRAAAQAIRRVLLGQRRGGEQVVPHPGRSHVVAQPGAHALRQGEGLHLRSSAAPSFTSPTKCPATWARSWRSLRASLGTAQGGLNYAYANKTVDQAIADKIGTTTRFKSLHVGVASTDASDADFGAVAKSISHNGPNSPNLPEYDPVALYDRVFGDGFSTGTTTNVATSPSPRARAFSIWSPPTRRRSSAARAQPTRLGSISICRASSSSRSSSWACPS